ncbi:hypothetical protein X474_22230 [Dethiosulfatarculus sandiegensis]|uniref:Uncharacterized protein n=1 Tax=Dethiosulfatarculus sandiegensis TaxID=1429043 RepID=A0A0D2J7U7_9BACT|nr:hypothetical protein X474_22230 [Dethiosulfatarculus sandiegensis]
MGNVLPAPKKITKLVSKCTSKTLERFIHIDESKIPVYFDEMVRGSVEQPLYDLLDTAPLYTL